MRGALLDAADHAERQLGRELHDGLGQDLVALSLIARAETDRMKRGGAPELDSLALIESLALRAVKNCRGITRGLSALTETGGDLYGALRRLFARERFDLLHIHAPVDIGRDQRFGQGLERAARSRAARRSHSPKAHRITSFASPRKLSPTP